MKKSILSLALILVVLFSIQNITFAAEQGVSPIPSAAVSYKDDITFAETDDVLNGEYTPKSTSLPTDSWNLADDDYAADLQIVGKSWLYTNYYFHPNGDGRIYVDYDVTADTSTTNLYIGLYDLTEDKLVVEFDPIEVRTTGKTGSMYFYNLVNSHKYAVCFRAHPSSLNGSAVIMH